MAESALTIWASVSAPTLPGTAVADAIGRDKLSSRLRQLAVFVVAKTKRRYAVVLDLDHELGRVRRAT